MGSHSLQSCKTLRQRQPETGWHGSVFRKPPLIAEASTMICTRPNFRAAPLFPNLDCNLCPTLQPTESQYIFKLAETGSRQVIHVSVRVLRWKWWNGDLRKIVETGIEPQMKTNSTFKTRVQSLCKNTRCACNVPLTISPCRGMVRTRDCCVPRTTKYSLSHWCDIPLSITYRMLCI